MKKIIKFLIPAAVLSASIVLAGCSGGEEDKGNVSDASKPAATKEGTAGQPSGADAGKESRAGDYK